MVLLNVDEIFMVQLHRLFCHIIKQKINNVTKMIHENNHRNTDF